MTVPSYYRRNNTLFDWPGHLRRAVFAVDGAVFEWAWRRGANVRVTVLWN